VTTIAQLTVSYRRTLLVSVALLALLCSWRATHLEFDFSFNNLFLVDEDEGEWASAVRKSFGSTGGSYLVAVLEGDDVLRKDALDAISAISDEVEKIPHVERVFSLATVPVIRGEAEGLPIRSLTALVDAGENPADLKASMLQSPLYVRRLISPDAKVTAIVALLEHGHQGIRARRPTIEAFKRSTAGDVPAGFAPPSFTGFPIAEESYADLVWRGFVSAQVTAVILIAITLFACFHAIRAVLIPLGVVAVATLITLGLMEVAGLQVTLITASVPLVILVVGVGEVAFFIARYYEESAGTHASSSELVVNSVSKVLLPAFIASATTSAGFASLLAGRIPMTRQFGFAVAAGIFIAFLVCVALVPGILSLFGPLPSHALSPLRRGWTVRLLELVATTNVRHPRIIILASVIGTVAAGMGASRVVANQYAMREIGPEHPLRVTQELVDSALMGAFQVAVGVRAVDRGSLLRPQILEQIERLQEFLAHTAPGHEDVVKAWSITDYVKELNLAWHNGEVGARRIPEDEAGARVLVSASERDSDIGDLINPARTLGVIMLGTRDLGTGQLQALGDRAREFVQSQRDNKLEICVVGDYWSIARGANSLVRDLMYSTLTAFLIILLLVGVCLRSLRLTILSIPPNLLPLLAALAFMGVAGFPLRVGTSIILPISLGIAVNATVHYLVRARAEWAVDGNYDAAMHRALLGTGRGMVFSSAVLILGFLCFLVPEFVVFHHVGLLASWTLVVALLTDLFLTPSLVRWLHPFGPSR
jgi:predicted RND superfamily exporter protein